MGLPCCFIRLSGCPFHCSYCDTEFAREEKGEDISIPAVLARLNDYSCRLVEVTGGEPLAQKDTPELLRALEASGRSVLLETSGHLPLDEVPASTAIVMDIKTPGSGRAGFHPGNLARLGPRDAVKFVICGREDFEWAMRTAAEHDLASRMTVFFSPAWGLVAPRDLAEWILDSGLAVRLQIPLHKLLWGDQRGT